MSKLSLHTLNDKWLQRSDNLLTNCWIVDIDENVAYELEGYSWKERFNIHKDYQEYSRFTKIIIDVQNKPSSQGKSQLSIA